MNLTRAFLGIGIVATVIFSGRSCSSSRYSEERNAFVGTDGAKLIRIVSDAGTLKIDGRPGQSGARVRGVAVGSGKSVVSKIRLTASRAGDIITIQPRLPSRRWFNWGNSFLAALDMVVTVPPGVAIEITDGSGDVVVRGVGPLSLSDGSGNVDVRGVRGLVDITDGSGDVNISGVEGDVKITDGSGALEISNVTGNVTIPDDGSGRLAAERIGGSVTIGDKGSGSLEVAHVGTDLVVERKGSGAIRYDDVRGKVAIPKRKSQ